MLSERNITGTSRLVYLREIFLGTFLPRKFMNIRVLVFFFFFFKHIFLEHICVQSLIRFDKEDDNETICGGGISETD